MGTHLFIPVPLVSMAWPRPSPGQPGRDEAHALAQHMHVRVYALHKDIVQVELQLQFQVGMCIKPMQDADIQYITSINVHMCRNPHLIPLLR